MRILTPSNICSSCKCNHHSVQHTDLYGAALGVRDLISQRHTFAHVRYTVLYIGADLHQCAATLFGFTARNWHSHVISYNC